MLHAGRPAPGLSQDCRLSELPVPRASQRAPAKHDVGAPEQGYISLRMRARCLAQSLKPVSLIIPSDGGSEAVGYLKQELETIFNKQAEGEVLANFQQCHKELDAPVGKEK